MKNGSISCASQRLIFSAGAALVFVAVPAGAADLVWTGSLVNTLFEDGNNWNPGFSPADGDTVTIDGTVMDGDSVTLMGFNSATIDGMLLRNGAMLSTDGGRLTVDDSTPAGPFTLINTSTTRLESGSGLFVNGGSTVGAGTPVVDFNPDTLIIGDGSFVLLADGSSSAPTPWMQVDRALTIEEGGSLESYDGRIVMNGPLNNNGRIYVSQPGGGPAALLPVNLTIDPLSGSSLIRVDLDGSDENGSIRVDPISVMEINAPLADSIDGRVELRSNSRLTIAGNASLGSDDVEFGEGAVFEVRGESFIGISNGGTPADIELTTFDSTIKAGNADLDDIRNAPLNPFDLRWVVSSTGATPAKQTIRDGARVDFNEGSGQIGVLFGEAGEVRIEGAGTTVELGLLDIGTEGDGTLIVEDGAGLTAGTVTIAFTSDSTSSATIDGAGSTWDITGGFTVGRAGVGELEITNGATVTQFDPSASVESSASVGLLSASDGSVVVDGAGSVWDIEGDLRVGFNVGGTGAPAGSGSVTVESGGLVMVGGDAIFGGDAEANDDVALVIDNARLEAGGDIRSRRDTTGVGITSITLNDATLIAGEDFISTAGINNSGVSHIEAGDALDLSIGNIQVNGLLSLKSLNTQISNSVVFSGNGSLGNAIGGRMNTDNSVDLNTASLENAGLLNLNSVSFGDLGLVNFVQTADGQYNADVRAASQFDQIAASGTAVLDGALAVFIDILSSPGELPAYVGLPILTADGGITGTFDRVLNVLGQPFLGDDEALAVTYTLTQVLVTRALFGDANLDGFISQSDLDAVLLNWGSTDGTWATGDLSGDGFVSQADLDAVLLNWGSGTPPVLAVPEPGSAAVLGVVCLFAAGRRRHPLR